MPSLNIDIRARYADAIDAFEKVQKQAEKTAERIDQSFKQALGGLFAGATFVAMAREFNTMIAQLSSFQDAAEKVGTSVENISSMFYDLRASNVPMTELVDAAGKLTRAMSGAEDETSDAGKAFKALGVDVKDGAGNLRDVTDVLRDVSVAIEQYADGANKVALAQAMFGKSGASMIPIFKDLAEVTEKSVGVTREQAEAADEFEKAMQRLFGQLEKAKIATYGGLIEPLTELIAKFTDAREAGLGFMQTLDLFIQDSANAARRAFGAAPISMVSGLREDLATLRKELEETETASSRRAVGDDPNSWMIVTGRNADQVKGKIAALEAQIAAVEETERRAASRRKNDSTAEAYGWDAIADKPQAPSIEASAAQKLIEQLNKQLATSEKMSAVQKARLEIDKARQKSAEAITKEEEKQILAIAKRIDAAKNDKTADKVTEGERLVDQLSRQVITSQKLSETEQVTLEIQRLREKSAKSVSAEEERRAIALAKQIDSQRELLKAKETEEELQKLIADSLTRDADRTAQKVAHYEDLADPVEKYLAQLREITKLEQDGFLNVETADKARNAISAQIDALKETKDELKENKSVAEEWGLTFTSSLEDVIAKTGDVRDAFEALAEDIRRMFARKLITEPLMNLISGAMSSWGTGSGPRDIGGGYTLYPGGSSSNSTGTSLRGIENANGIDYGAVTPKSQTVNVTLNGSGVTMQDVTRAVRAGNSEVIAMSADQGRRG